MAITPSELLLIIKAKDEATKVLEEISKQSKGVEKGFGAIGKGLSTVGGVALGAAGAGIAAAVGILGSSIGPASDLNETLSKTTVVFGDQAAAVMKFAQTSTTALGMTQNEALAAAATYGNLFRSMEMSESTSAEMSTGLVQLAADLASFNNIDPSIALDKLRAGLTGEAEPLKALGVNINQALIEQKAFELGLWDGEQALTANMKAQASYALIMEQTALAQGDFARTSDGLANQQRIVGATLEQLRATIGTALLPAITALVSKFAELASDPRFQEFIAKAAEAVGNLAMKVVEALPGIIDWFQKISDWLSEHEGVIIGVLVALGLAVAVFAKSVIVSMAPVIAGMAPVILAITAIAAAVALLYEAWKNDWSGIRTTLTRAWEKIQPVFETIKQWLATAIPAAIDAMGKAFTWVKDNVLTPVKGAFDGIREAIEKVVNWVGTVGEKLSGIKDKLPDWLVPGSPTPLELGLIGITDAMRTLSQSAVPQLDRELAKLEERGGFGGGLGTYTTAEGDTVMRSRGRRQLTTEPGMRERAEAPTRDRESGMTENETMLALMNLIANMSLGGVNLTLNITGDGGNVAKDAEIGVISGLRALGVGF